MKKLGKMSISQVEGWEWTDDIPTPETDSGVVNRFYRLHDKPIIDLELADIRFLITQNADLEYLVPIVIKALSLNPLIETEYYKGDLLCSLLKSTSTEYNLEYWKTHTKEKQEVIDLYIKALDASHVKDEDIIEAYEEFLSRTS